MRLYEIDKAILDCIMVAVDEMTGEVTDELLDVEKINKLHLEKSNKIEYLAKLYLNTTSDAEAYKNEKNRLARLQKRAENKANSIKSYLDFVLNGENFKQNTVNITYKKSESVEIYDLDKLDSSFQKIKYEADKTKIKLAFKNGIEVEHASLVTKHNIQIK